MMGGEGNFCDLSSRFTPVGWPVAFLVGWSSFPVLFHLRATLEGSVALGAKVDTSSCYLRQVAVNFLTMAHCLLASISEKCNKRSKENRQTRVN